MADTGRLVAFYGAGEPMRIEEYPVPEPEPGAIVDGYYTIPSGELVNMTNWNATQGGAAGAIVSTAEDMARVRDEILPMAERLGVGILAMKPLAGGLLACGRAFPARAEPAPGPRPAAGDVLRAVLQHSQVTCVVPGAASPMAER